MIGVHEIQARLKPLNVDILDLYAKKMDEKINANLIENDAGHGVSKFELDVINAHISEYEEMWRVEKSKYSGMKKLDAGYLFGIGRIVKHNGVVKEGTLKNGAWVGLYRVITKNSVTYHMHVPGYHESSVKFELIDGELKESKKANGESKRYDPYGLLKDITE